MGVSLVGVLLVAILPRLTNYTLCIWSLGFAWLTFVLVGGLVDFGILVTQL
jgi:hypothetical protein